MQCHSPESNRDLTIINRTLFLSYSDTASIMLSLVFTSFWVPRRLNPNQS